MDINSVNGATNAPTAAMPDIPQSKAAENRSIIQAVKAVNGTEMFGQDNHLTFERDPASKQMVIQVVNQQTHEVVLQIPPEYVLRLAEDLKQQEANASHCKTG
jgi:uncharacterized FlaG/YvyC family protein